MANQLKDVLQSDFEKEKSKKNTLDISLISDHQDEGSSNNDLLIPYNSGDQKEKEVKAITNEQNSSNNKISNLVQGDYFKNLKLKDIGIDNYLKNKTYESGFHRKGGLGAVYLSTVRDIKVIKMK